MRSGAAAFIFVTILLDMLALGLILPILPKLVESFVDNDTATAARIFGLFGTAWALMQFLFSPILGALSDRFGRRPVVLLSNFGLALDYVLMALAPSLTWLFIGRVISGITSASISTAFAYIADVTPPERRAAVFGKIGAAFGAGFILGPAIGGLLGGMDPRLPFWIAAGLSFANTLYGWLILPESLPPERRAPFRWKSASPLGALHLLRSNRILAGLSLANFFGQVAHVVLPSTFVLYATYRYGWDTTTVGLTLALVGVCAMVVQGAGVGPIVTRLGERRALLLGLACGALGFFIYGAAPTGPLFWLGIPVMALWGVAGAAIQALTTQLVAPDQQGQLQGATNSVNSIAQMVGPFLFTLTFAYFISDQAPVKMPGAPFLLAAALLGLGLVIAWRTLATKKCRVGKPKACPPFAMRIGEMVGTALAPLPTLRFLLRRSLLHQRTLAGFERLGGVFGRDRGDLLVIVPRSLRLFRLLHLEQIGRDETAAVGAQRALAEQRIVGRQFLHLGDDLGAVMRIAAERFHRLQIMQHHGVVAGLGHRGHRVLAASAANRFDQARVWSFRSQ